MVKMPQGDGTGPADGKGRGRGRGASRGMVGGCGQAPGRGLGRCGKRDAPDGSDKPDAEQLEGTAAKFGSEVDETGTMSPQAMTEAQERESDDDLDDEAQEKRTTTLAVVDEEACTPCGACHAACPEEAIRLGDDSVRVLAEVCCGCGACVDVCPSGAIRMV
ncbi:MAG: 4Fe-4S binding protein [Phycisphaerales bacterium]|nr:MAG: 4Fe-4S binding protein [Phycisphaerales bacterium]